MTEAPDQRKESLRARMRETLSGLDEVFRHNASTAACANLIQLDAFRHASVVMLYMPLAEEVDLTPAAIGCFATGKTVCVPHVDWKRRDMEAVEITSFDDEVMDLDTHGIRTPREGTPLLPRLIDLIVVPGLAFDPTGNRLGRGGGYYDRFLGRLRRSATTVGIAFDVQVINEVPADDRDMAVEIVVTERRVACGDSARAAPP